MCRFSILLTLAAVLSASGAMAQFTVENDTKTTREEVKFEEKMKGIDASTEYYNAARARAEQTGRPDDITAAVLQLEPCGH